MLKEVLFEAEVERKANRPAKQSAHDIALLFVTRHHAVNSQEGGGAQMVGNHAHTGGVAFVLFATECLQLFDNRPQQANPEDVWAVELRGGDTL